MEVVQQTLIESSWHSQLEKLTMEPSIILLFISPLFPDKEEVLTYLTKKFPKASITGCSTAGEISNVSVTDRTISFTAIKFNKITHKKVAVPLNKIENSFKSGVNLGNKLLHKDLKHILLFSDGLNVNGADLISGLKSVINSTSVTGGLAADGPDFKKTFVVNNNKLQEKTIVGIGLYGDSLKVGFGSKGGWDSFGIERLVTKSEKNILFELDHTPALDVYKSYLGDKAKDLPSSGLLFPLSMRTTINKEPIVRTILSVDEKNKSLTFAGNIPKGAYVRLMKANVDRLINGAETSAEIANKSNNYTPALAILISCVGRRLVLKQLVEEEIESVRDVLGSETKITGFYSYGEIAPFGEFSACELHNQTMTITTLTEEV
ncbi:FIST signal transduction protein [Patiriisocius hiemis]|uniref:FIST C-terminal domain-containing protein n=1 Tax=Patiriisocius hiemis TaxID=3075604 RepID=A0ABU2YCN1_9FLAO|nr:FIST N-terminal domain-containing protein [Constantimarinum sp. W242]MDT0555933.1 FIST C-terminal domain-containing protein [Constantimarinum sp. W242]